jgi:signal transduction histidine kinase
LSHEFRTPLTYITGYADLIQEQGLDPDQLRQFLRRLQSGSNRLSRLVEDFLFLVSLEAGEAHTAYTLQRDRFSEWVALLDRVKGKLADKIANAKVTLTVDIAPNLPETVLHASYIEDMVRRLVDNAVKFMLGKPGQVLVSVMRQDDHIVIHVKDDGIGIAEEDLPTIFQPFQQIDREKHEQQGAGVGLAIVKGIVDLHGGRVEVVSRPGEGSVFSVWLPITQE